MESQFLILLGKFKNRKDGFLLDYHNLMKHLGETGEREMKAIWGKPGQECTNDAIKTMVMMTILGYA